MANINSVITYNANLSPAQAQIKALTGQIGALSAAFNTLDKSALSAQRSLAATFATGVGQIGGFTAKTVQATNAVDTFGKQIEANRLGMRQYFREAITGYTRQNSMLRQLAAQQVRYQQSIAVPVGGGQAMMLTPQSINAAGSAAALASQRFSIFNQLVNGGATEMLNWGKNTQWAGRQLMVGFTVPLMLFTAVASKQFRELDKELTRFQKVYGSDLGGAMSDATARMREDVKELAYEISRTYGIAAKETAALAADIAATGAEGEQLMASVQQTTRLAVLGEVDRQEAMKATLALQSAFRLNTNELAESINFLNAVENQTSATLEDLSTAIPKVGPVVRSLGGDIRDLAELLVAMREGGIPAAEAANALKSGLASLINPTKQASAVAKSFGVDLVGIVEANRGQLMPTIYAMKDALAGLDSFSRSRIIEQIFGKYQFARITALFDNIGRAGSQTQQVVELASKSSAELAAIANGEIRTLTESTAVKFQRTLEELKNSIMPIGEVLTETLIPIFEFIGKGVKMFTSFFQALPEPVKNFAKYGVAIAALAGPIIMLVGLFGNLFANALKFGMMLTRIGARIAGIKTEKFELLTADVMAAKLGVDRLTTSFDTQEKALLRLTGVLSSYEASLRRLTTANPALFVPGAIPSARGAMPIRRQGGSDRPEFVPGSGRGDKIPAMLEPGEFIVNRAATEKYAPVLMEMNRGTLKGFVKGTQEYNLSHLGAPRVATAGQVLMMPGISESARAMASLVAALHGAEAQILIYSNAVVNLTKDTNLQLERGKGVKAKILRQELATSDAFIPLQDQLRRLIIETGEFAGDINLAEQAANEFATKIRSELSGIRGTVSAAKLGEITRSAVGGMSPATSALMTRLLERETTMQPKGLGAGNLSMFAAMTGQPLRGKGDSLTVGIGGKDVRIRSSRGGERVGLYEDIRPYKGSATSILSSSAASQYSKVSTSTLPKPYSYTSEGSRFYGAAAASVIESNIKDAILKGIILGTRSSSPSKEADARFTREGKNVADGMLMGLQKGFRAGASMAGSSGVLGPVTGRPVGPGLESTGPAIKVREAMHHEAGARTTLARALQKEVIIQGMITDSQLRTDALQNQGNVTLANWTKSLETGIWVHKDGAVAAKKRTETLEALAIEEANRLALEKKLSGIVTIRQRAEERAAETARIKASSDEALSRANTARAAASFGVGPGGSMGYFMGGVSPYGAGKPGPSSSLSNRPTAPTGPAVAIGAAKDSAQGGMRGMGAMNAMFALSMVTSSISMMGGASSDAAMKLGLFTTALMTATMMMNMGIGKNTFTNFLGMRSLGGKLGQTNAARLAANPALAQRASSIASAGGLAGGRMAGQGAAAGLASGGGRMGATLLGASRVLSVAGGPIGIAAGLGITAAITGFMMYRNAAEEARERAIAAFNDPVKSAEYFGETITNVSDILEKNRLSNISEDLQEVDQALRDAVSQDYAPLIEQIKFLSAGAGAQQLSVAYSNMILSGMSAENAKAAVEAIAAEAGIAGGQAFNEAVAQGFLNELTTSEALQNIIGQFKPSETTYGKTGETLESRLRKDIAQAESDLEDARRAADEQAAANARAVGGEPLPDWFPDFMKPSAVNPEVERLTNLVDQLRDRLEDLMSINPELISGVLDSLILAYQQDPTAAINGIKEFADTINSLENEDDRTAALDRVTDYLRDSYGEQWTVVGESIDTANEKLLAAQMLAAGISLDRAVNSAYEFDSALAQSLITAKLLADEAGRAASELQTELTDEIVSDIEDQRRTVETEMQDIENANAKIIRGYNRRKREAQTAFETEQEGRQENIDSMQDEMDQSRRIFDEEMQQLDDKKEAVSKSSEAYIDSLEKTQKAESFYSQQRKTAFGALQKLASGDVFGFLQERQQMSQDAQEFSYDEMISGIEERRDLELEGIDEVREKKQREQDEYEQMMEDRIKSEQDLMDEQQKTHDAQMEHYEKQIKKADREKEQKITRKREEIEELNTMQETASRDILEFQKKYAKEFEKYDQYARQLENLKILRVQEIYFRGGVTLNEAALQAGIVSGQVGPFIEKNAGQFSFVENAGTSFAQNVIPTGSTYYKGITTPLPDTQDLSQTVKDMTVTGDIVVNGDIVGGSADTGSDPSTWSPGTAGDTRQWNGETYTYSPGSGWVPAAATGGYIQNGRVMLEGGGKVTGPGGPKSDVIPAMLSNGEYVIQASSVGKYGKDMMDTINAGKFAEGGLAAPNQGLFGILNKIPAKEKAPAPGTTGMPGTGTTGVAAAARPTTTTIGGQGGPNGWPWISSYNSGLLDTKKIPGTNVNLTMNKDVLPLFLALASDYNRTIRKIGPGSGGFDPRTDRPESERAKSNHPSGTAMDINWSEEGALSDSTDLFNWWKTGKTSAGAPWKPISPQPYKTALSLKNKYKVVDWFGPTSLGGYINGTPDYMHWQISQGGGVVTPQRVAQVIGELGLNPDGTFNRPNTYAAGGFISGPGGPRSDMIPAMLSNGEYVVKASAVSKYGKGFMDQVNAGQFGMGGLATTAPRMVSPAKYAGGGFVGSISTATPTFGIPQMESINPSSMNANIANSYGGSNSSSVRNSSKVNIVINGAGGKSSNAIANKVISMINQANGRRNHSRSAG